MPVIETRSIDWRCHHCRVTGRLPHIDSASVADVRDAIDRGHERRSTQCHEAYGLRHVRAVQDGKTLRFGSPPTPTLEDRPHGR